MITFLYYYNQLAANWLNVCIIAVGIGVIIAIIFALSLIHDQPKKSKKFENIKESSL